MPLAHLSDLGQADVTDLMAAGQIGQALDADGLGVEQIAPGRRDGVDLARQPGRRFSICRHAFDVALLFQPPQRAVQRAGGEQQRGLTKALNVLEDGITVLAPRVQAEQDEEYRLGDGFNSWLAAGFNITSNDISLYAI